MIEDRALALADALEPTDAGLAGRLRECVPEGYGACDEHRASLRAVLREVAEDSAQAGRFSAFWDDDTGWLEQGPETAPLEEVVAWARRRTDDLRHADGRRPF